MIEGNVVDVRSGRVIQARVSHEAGVIRSVEKVSHDFDGYLIPGLIDSHIHIESTLLCPSRFAEVAVPHGTTAVVGAPHEIANVLGLPGMEYVIKDSATVPLRFYFTAPSCVPATLFETSGAAFGPGEIEQLLVRDEFVALGEMMDYPGAIARDPAVMAKIDVARRLHKPIDGHAPLLSGPGLEEYVSLGISTDHECTSFEEACQKASLGMVIMVRQGSASRDLEHLAPFAREHEFILVSDDMSASDLIQGYLDRSLAEATALGIDPVHALRAATINPALHYGLPLGAIEVGRKADIVKVRDLRSFEVEEVYIGGELVASGGVARFDVRPKEMANRFFPQRKMPSDFEVTTALPNVDVRVIGLIEDEIVTESLVAGLRSESGKVMPDIESDILRISVVNRYQDAPVSNGFVKGFGLKSGAFASTVAHDSHNIIVVGVGSDSMATAVNALIQEGGGFCVCSDGRCTMLNLRIAGLMCTKPAHEVKRVLDSLVERVRALGCTVRNPFMTLSFLSLLVIPKLKLGDKGLFDGESFRFVDVIKTPSESGAPENVAGRNPDPTRVSKPSVQG